MDNLRADSLTGYFSALDERLDDILPARVSLLTHICGYTVRLIFPSVEYTRYTVPDMFVSPDSGKEPVDATFIWWEDWIFPYQLHNFADKNIFRQLGNNIFLAEDSTGYVEIVGDVLRAVNFLNKRYYLLSNPFIESKSHIICHPFEKAVFSWAQTHDLLMLHAAAVGVDGRGVLIVGHGGTGKSTLSCSCLADGFDFVSDDLCLLTGNGPRTVFPVYKNIFLKADSLTRLPMFKPFEIIPQQGEKSSFSIGETRIAPSLSVEAIVLPQVTDNEEPEIKRDQSSKALGQLVFSTARPRARFRETGFARKLAQRLLGMPVYRFSLTKDLQKNTQCFKKWIKEDLSCTN